MNDLYVSIKVDREERPDVDAIYMTAVQALTGSGGWPMSVWLTPDREPFFGGPYFMPASRSRTVAGAARMSFWVPAAGEPFFGGTYFPPRDGARGARHGFT